MNKRSFKRPHPTPEQKVTDHQTRFKSLFERAIASGISAEKIVLLDSVKKIQNLGRTYNADSTLSWLVIIRGVVRKHLASCVWLRIILGVMAILGSFLFCYLGLYSRDGWVALVAENAKLEQEPCLVEVPVKLQSALMPPVDCAMCRGLKAVERKVALSQRDFEMT